jgi:hypothetical protein
MLKENINWEKYSNLSIELILNKTEKLLDESVSSYRETTNKCYAALAVYLGIIAYCLDKILSNQTNINCVTYIICLVGSSVSLIFLFDTLIPAKIGFSGCSPDKLLIEDFEDFDDKLQERYYKETFIEKYDELIENNFIIVKKRSSKFCNSIISLVVTFLFCTLWLFYLFFIK